MEEGRHGREGFASVEVVRIDDAEGFMDFVPCREDGVAGAPGFDAAAGDGEIAGQIRDVLIHQRDGQVGLEPGNDALPEDGFAFAPDDKNDAAKAGAFGIEDGIIEEGLAVRTHGIGLFGLTAVAAAHTGSEDKEGGKHEGKG